MDSAEEKAADAVKRRRDELASRVQRGGEDELKRFLAPFSVVPEEHSLAKGTATPEAQKAFQGWTTTFKNTDPVTIVWFPDGVPDAIHMARTQAGGIMSIQAKGARTAPEAEFWARHINQHGGCGVLFFNGILCYQPHCIPSKAFKRCMHYVTSYSANERDAQRGYEFMRAQVESDPRLPHEKWDLSGERPRRFGR